MRVNDPKRSAMCPCRDRVYLDDSARIVSRICQSCTDDASAVREMNLNYRRAVISINSLDTSPFARRT